MDELIRTVAQKAGIDPDQARTAVQAVLDHLRTVLPQPMASQLDSFIGGSSGQGAGGIQGAIGGLEGMLSGQQGQGAKGQTQPGQQQAQSGQQQAQSGQAQRGVQSEPVR